MPFSYHPPTRTHCPVCEKLAKSKLTAVLEGTNGKASSAGNFPVHNWYYFVLGYTPKFPDYLIQKFEIKSEDFVVDPFNGSGTTMVACKMSGIDSAGIEANDYFIDVARSKLNWDIDVEAGREYWSTIKGLAISQFEQIDFDLLNTTKLPSKNGRMHYLEYSSLYRPPMLSARYLSDRPFVRISVIKSLISDVVPAGAIRDLFHLAISSILVPISNVRYGPGFGVSKPKEDVDVIKVLEAKVAKMFADLEAIKSKKRLPKTKVIHGDARKLSDYFKSNSIDFMITSPPYPGDHEYTKHTRLELLFMGYANDLTGFREIKKRMIRGSTTNIYKEDNDRTLVEKIKSIQEVTDLIEQRLDEDGATSGFEKLYTKLVWEYFGGMHKVFEQSLKVLKRGGKFALLVSDSHAFKMVHIETAKILGEIASALGYKKVEIELWQDKTSSSHGYHIPENILILTK